MFLVLSDRWRCTRDEFDGPMDSLADMLDVLLWLLVSELETSIRRRTPLTWAAGTFFALYACRIEYACAMCEAWLLSLFCDTVLVCTTQDCSFLTLNFTSLCAQTLFNGRPAHYPWCETFRLQNRTCVFRLGRPAFTKARGMNSSQDKCRARALAAAMAPVAEAPQAAAAAATAAADKVEPAFSNTVS